MIPKIYRSNSSSNSSNNSHYNNAHVQQGNNNNMISLSYIFLYSMITGLFCCLCNMIYITIQDIHVNDVVLSDIVMPSSSSSSSSSSSLLSSIQHQQRERYTSKNDNNNNNHNRKHNNNNNKNDNSDRNPLTEREVQTLPQEWDIETKTTDVTNPIRQLLIEAIGNPKHTQKKNKQQQQQEQITIDEATLQRLPSVQDVVSLYGATPVVLGLETCHIFQYENSHVPDPADHLVSVAGSFNTGTNLLAELLIANCYIPPRQEKYQTPGVRWQVLWGKHTPVDDESFRQSHRTYKNESNNNNSNEPPSLSADAMFPAITIRDPFKWMQSMCRHSYGADWVHDPGHCPNLVPNEVDEQLFDAHGIPITSTMNVTVYYAEFIRQHNSLVEFWNDWNLAYVNAKFPRLMVRFEDIVFHPKQITKTVCECAGGQIYTNQPFQYVVESAKKGAAHGHEKTSYVDALVKYGTEAGRYTGFTKEDIQYAKQHLDPNLMRLFGYHYPTIYHDDDNNNEHEQQEIK